jgi:hypothetical protein
MKRQTLEILKNEKRIRYFTFVDVIAEPIKSGILLSGYIRRCNVLFRFCSIRNSESTSNLLKGRKERIFGYVLNLQLLLIGEVSLFHE